MLAVLVLAVSCVNQPKDDDGTTAPADSTNNPQQTAEETEFKAFDTVTHEKYGGYSFNILYTQTDNCYTDFFAQEENGSILNDAVFKRNIKVEEALDIKTVITWKSYGEVNTTIETLVKSGDYEFDMYGGHRSSLALSYGGYLYDFYNMENIDLSSEWWDPDWVSTMSVDNSIYALVGDISISSLLFVSSLCFNKNLFDANGLTYPYELVRNNKWTYDEFISLIGNYSQDLNGDGALTWDSDRFGLSGWGTEAGYSMFYGSGFTFITKTESDSYALQFNTERLTQIMDKVFEAWITSNSYFNNSGTAAQHAYPFNVFKEGRALFCDTVLSKIGTFLLDMQNDYGIVPQPMFDENQSGYSSYTGYTIPITMVPVNCQDPARTGNIIEAFCTASYDDVTPDMYEIVTAVKNVRDAESSEMIQIIIRSKSFDPAHWYNIDGYGSFARTLIGNGNNNVASSIKTFAKIADKKLASILAEFEKLKNR